MSLLDRLRPDAPAATGSGSSASDGEPDGVLLALLTGLVTGALSWLVVALPALLAWATSAQASAAWGQAVRVSTDLWLAAHRVPIGVPGGRIAFAPLGLTALLAWLCWLAGRRLVGSARALWRVLAFAAGYAGVVVLAAAAARSGVLQPSLLVAVVAGLVLPAAAAGAAVLRANGTSLESALTVLRLPPVVVDVTRGAVMAVLSLVAIGSVLLAATTALHLDRVLTLHQALDPGAIGGGVLTLGELGLVPNGVLWAVAFLAGPGFALGAGSLVSPGGSALGLLPLVPVLGAVPAPGALPTALWAVLLLPVVVGGLLGWWVVVRAAPDGTGVRGCVGRAVVAALLAAGALAVLAWLSGGSAGPGTLGQVGPSAWRVGLALAGELGAGAAVAAWVAARRRDLEPGSVASAP